MCVMHGARGLPDRTLWGLSAVGENPGVHTTEAWSLGRRHRLLMEDQPAPPAGQGAQHLPTIPPAGNSTAAWLRV